MFAQILLGLGLLSLVAAFSMTLVGVRALWGQRFARKVASATAATAPGSAALVPPSVVLEGKGPLTLEQGVLLNTLWEHLPSADCQEGECGGCKVRLLEGQVRWIREPVAQFDRSTHILACSCEPLGPVRCALDGAVA
jgi:ferredoxin